MIKTLLKIILVAVVAIGAYYYFLDDAQETVEVEEVSYEEVLESGSLEVAEGDEEEVVENEDEEELAEVVEEEEEVEDAFVEVEPEEEVIDPESDLPSQFNLAVPFTPQAPHANWDLPYQEACEEASAYMVSLYYQGVASGLVDPDVADAALWELVTFQNDLFGDYLDTTAVQTAQFIDQFYNLSTDVVEDPTVDQIKAEIAAGRPVIVPAAGRELGNPNFSGAGPVYHMLVIKGYTETQFITNDPGTRNGEDYVYDIDVLMSAMGDWNDGDPANGASRVIFVWP